MPSYVWPPHPHTSMKIIRDQLPYYEKMGAFLAQRKFQGSRSPTRIYQGKAEIVSRHGGAFKRYQLPKELHDCIVALKVPRDREVWLDGELLHEKAVDERTGKQAQENTIVFFDILFDGGFLLDKDQQWRLDRLAEICDHPTRKEVRGYARVVAEGKGCCLWMAETFDRNFTERYDEFDKYDPKGRNMHQLIEGLVLRRKKFRLPTGLKEYDTRDIVRVRRPTKVRSH